MCFLYTWSRQGSCGVVPGRLLVFLIAPLNLWTTREPSHLTRYPLAGKRRSKGRGLQRQQSSLCCSYLQSLPNDASTSTNKGVSTAETLVLYMPFSSTSPAITTMLTNGKQRHVLKPINYYYGLCKNKESCDHSLFFLLLSYINWDFFVCFDRDWIFNPMTKCISPCCSHVKFLL